MGVFFFGVSGLGLRRPCSPPGQGGSIMCMLICIELVVAARTGLKSCAIFLHHCFEERRLFLNIVHPRFDLNFAFGMAELHLLSCCQKMLLSTQWRSLIILLASRIRYIFVPDKTPPLRELCFFVFEWWATSCVRYWTWKVKHYIEETETLATPKLASTKDGLR